MPKKSQREGCHCSKAFSVSKFTQKGWQYLRQNWEMAPFPSLPPPPRALFAESPFSPASSARKLLANSIGGCQSPSHVCRKGTDQVFQMPFGLARLSQASSSSSAFPPKLLLWSCQDYQGGKISTGPPHFSWSLRYDQQQVTEYLMRNKKQREHDFLSTSKTR